MSEPPAAGPLDGPLGQAFLSVPALQAAFVRVMANQGAPGVDGVSVHTFGSSLQQECEALHAELAAGRYQPLPMRRVWLPKKRGGRRGLAIPAVRDRVVQCAIAQGLLPALEREFETQSYAYRPGRGVQDAVAAVARGHEQGCMWILDADIDGFFDEVSHELLIPHLAKHLPEPGLLQLVLDMLICPIQEEDGQVCPMRGLPQGSPLSPMLANLFLDPLDEAISAHWRHVRYADDFIVLLPSQDEASEALRLVQAVLHELGLKLHAGKTGVRSFAEGFEFLGARFLGKACWFEWSGSVSPAPAVVRTPPSPTATAMSQAFAAAGLAPIPAPSVEPPSVSRRVTGTDSEKEADQAADQYAEETGDGVRFVPWLRTLYVLESGAYLAKDGERVLVRRGEQELIQIPVAALDIVLLLGHAVLSTPFMRFAAERDLLVAICDPIGRLYGLWPGQQVGHVVLQAAQFAAATNMAHTLPLAREFVRGKLTNARLLMKRLHRHRHLPPLEQAARQIERLMAQAPHAASLDSLRGMEGAAAAAYFGAWRRCLPGWGFERRERHGRDRINQMLNLAYGVLRANVLRCVASRGLHPGVGFLHAMRDGHPALVSDLMEEFRPLAADAVVLQLALSGRIEPDNGPLDDDARRQLLRALESKLNAPMALPDAGERLDLRRVIDAQARRLVRHLGDKGEPYRAWTAR